MQWDVNMDSCIIQVILLMMRKKTVQFSTNAVFVQEISFLVWSFEPGSHHVDQAAMKLTEILLPPPPKFFV